MCVTTPFTSATASLLNTISKRSSCLNRINVRARSCYCTHVLCRRDTRRPTPGPKCNTMTRKRRKIGLRMSHIPIPIFYTLQPLLVSLKTRILPSRESSGHGLSAQLATGRYLKMVTNLHIARPKPSRASSGLLLLVSQLSGQTCPTARQLVSTVPDILIWTQSRSFYSRPGMQ